MTPKSDKELLMQLRAGDSRAHDAIFLKYYRLLCVNAYFFLKDEQEAKDLVQIFFVDMWEKKLYKNLDGDIKGYLYRSVQNRCLNSLRKKETDFKRQSVFEQTYESTLKSDDPATQDSLYISLKEALFELPQKRREALQMIYLEDKKYIEAAEHMGISINSLKTHLKIGLKNLRSRMKTIKTS